MSRKEKDTNHGEIEIIKVTRGSDEDEKPVTEEKRPTALTTPFFLPSGKMIYLVNHFLDPFPWSRSGVVSEADAIGRDIQTERLITIGDAQRCGGLYVLGQPRTGKSNLLVGLALSDIRRNHGILFIDPHTDAINDLLSRMPENRRDDIVLLDPTDKQFSFGINLLHCRDRTDGIELDNACGRVRDVFVKVWGDERGQLGVWLDKIIRNTVYLLLENPGYTLVDLPLLLWEDTTFRNNLLKNVTVKTGVKDFWYREFDRLTKRERTEQVQPAQNRLNIFSNNTMIQDIVGQVQSTIDFGQILLERKIVLLRLPTNLASDVKHLIGTIVLSEVLYAAFEREKLPEAERTYFGVYCDEFQEFATPDFARLFTQTGKYKVMPVVAHQTRLGQFKPGDPNQGATLASPNKVLFTLSAADARELALEFAEAPPTETRLEEQYVVSQNPVYDLLRGHTNPQIRAFVDRHIRPLKEQLEDIRDEMEGERLIRMDLLDEAALSRIDERMDWLRTRGPDSKGLRHAAGAMQLARLQTAKMQSILETAVDIKTAVREINRFMTAVMEGKTAKGHDEFAMFLIARMRNSPRLPEEYRDYLELSISLQYGDPTRARAVPFRFAKAHGLFTDAVALYERERDAKNIQIRANLFQKNREKPIRERADGKRELEEVQTKYREAIRREIANWQLAFQEEFFKRPRDILVMYIPILEHASVREVIAPFLTAKLGPPWKNQFPDMSETLAWLGKEVGWQRRYTEEVLTLFYWHNPPPWSLYRSFPRLRPKRPAAPTTYADSTMYRVFAPGFLDAFQKFVDEYQEGAVIALLLLLTVRTPRAWRPRPFSPYLDSIFAGGYFEIMDKIYWRFNMLCLPSISGYEPLTVFLALAKLAEIFPRLDMETACRKYKWDLPSELYSERGEPYRGPQSFGEYGESGSFTGRYFSKELEGLADREYSHSSMESDFGERDRRGSVRYHLLHLRQSLTPEGKLLVAHPWWSRLAPLVQTYVKMRALDIALYGTTVADRTFPQPTLTGVSSERLSALVTGMANIILEECEAERVKEENEWYARYIKRMDEESEREFPTLAVAVSEDLPPQVFSEREKQDTIQACRREVEKSQEARAMLEIIDQFAGFCLLLGKPENHIKVRTGQYMERHVQIRQEADMVNEMARVMTSLPKYTAYAKIVEEKGGEPGVWKGKIRTVKLTAVQEDAAAETRRTVVAKREDYCRPRKHIQEEIDRRQKKWRAPQTQAETPSGRREEERRPPQARERVASVPDESPPPIRAVTQSAEGMQQKTKADDVRKERVASVPDESPPPTRAAAMRKAEGKKVWEYLEASRRRERCAGTDDSAQADGECAPQTTRMRLIYRSDFTKPTGWDEGHSDKVNVFRLDGYYHIAVYDARKWAFFDPPMIVDDFKAQVDVELNMQSAKMADCGMVFCAEDANVNGTHFFYAFTVSPHGFYRLHRESNEDAKIIIDWQRTNIIKSGDNTNSLMVEKVGEKVTLGINNQIVATTTDSEFKPGHVGMFVRSYTDDLYAEARFRNFLLYAIEK